MKLAITGTTGYVGERLLLRALNLGHEIVALTRRPLLNPGIAQISFDLASDAKIELPEGVSAVIHLAATTRTTQVDVAAEVSAARLLIAAVKSKGARFVFVSSQTAREDAPTDYGKAKWLIERETLAAGGLVIRPGLVYGGRERALFGELVRTVRSLPVIPAFLPAPKIQPIHVDDLAEALLAGVVKNTLFPGILCVGDPSPVTFTSFLQAIERERLGRFRPVLPVPVSLVQVAGVLMGQGLASQFGLNRLTSLFDLPGMETVEDLRKLGVTLRPLSDGLVRSGNGRRRSLIREGRAFLVYTLREQPEFALIRRYVRAVEQLRGGCALSLPWFVLRAPTLMALLDDRSLRGAPMGDEFTWRVNAAVVLGEASLQGARRYLQLGEPAGFWRGVLKIARAVGSDLSWCLARSCLSPILRPTLRNAELWK